MFGNQPRESAQWAKEVATEILVEGNLEHFATGQVFTADGVFIGQSAEFFAVATELAKAADAARHGS